MTKEREALRLALENLLQATRHLNACPATVEAAEKALAQSEQWTPDDMVYRPGGLVRAEPTPTPEQLAALGWQSIECPFCGTSGARAFPKPEQQWTPDDMAYRPGGVSQSERPQNCGSGFCSCIECVMKPERTSKYLS